MQKYVLLNFLLRFFKNEISVFFSFLKVSVVSCSVHICALTQQDALQSNMRKPSENLLFFAEQNAWQV